MTQIKTIAGIKEAKQRQLVARLLSGVTQQALADETGTSRGTIKRINAQMRPIILAEQEAENDKIVTDEDIIAKYTLDRRKNSTDNSESLKGRKIVINEQGSNYLGHDEDTTGFIGEIISDCNVCPDVRYTLDGDIQETYLDIEDDFFLIALPVEAPVITVNISIEPVITATVVATTSIPQGELEDIQQDIAERVSETFCQMYGHTEGSATIEDCDNDEVSNLVNEEFNVTVELSAGDSEADVVNAILDALGLEQVAEVVVESTPSSFTLVPNSIINIAHDGGIFTADMTHPCFKEIVNSAVEGDFDTAVDMIDVAKAVTAYSDGAVTIDGEKVLYNGMEVKDGLAMRILELMREGDVGFKKYVAFMGRLRANPSYRAVTELFGFIGHADVEITEDGYLIGWKRVKSNYTDCRTGLVKNYIGNIIQMPRNMVNEDSDQTCSQGLHVAAWSYLSHFSGAVILKVKVDPADVVSIPTDYKDSKMRAARYEPIAVVNWDKKEIEAEYTGNQILTVGEYGAILKVEDRA